MEQNNQRNSRKRLNSLILLVAFTAVMLIVSTYAWFSTQKTVTLSGLQGQVNVAEGLQISLDGDIWTNNINFAEVLTNPAKYLKTANATLKNPYEGGFNVLPTEMLPVSTTAGANDGIGSTSQEVIFYQGINENTDDLHTIDDLTVTTTATDAEAIAASNAANDALGYYAIDLYLMNSSATDMNWDQLQLEQGSDVELNSVDKEYTGLQNTLRVAFALFSNDASANATVGNNVTGAQVRAATSVGIEDVAIWEPNANAHVQYIVDNNNNVKFSADDMADEKYTGLVPATATKNTTFGLTSVIPTYALTSTATTAAGITGATAGSIADIYDWATPATGLAKQKVVATNAVASGGITSTVQLKGTAADKTNIKLKDTSTAITTDDFIIEAGQFHKLRMYVWLEGQDVDCINYASHGGKVDIDVSISKPGSENVVEPEEP